MQSMLDIIGVENCDLTIYKAIADQLLTASMLGEAVSTNIVEQIYAENDKLDVYLKRNKENGTLMIKSFTDQVNKERLRSKDLENDMRKSQQQQKTLKNQLCASIRDNAILMKSHQQQVFQKSPEDSAALMTAAAEKYKSAETTVLNLESQICMLQESVLASDSANQILTEALTVKQRQLEGAEASAESLNAAAVKIAKQISIQSDEIDLDHERQVVEMLVTIVGQLFELLTNDIYVTLLRSTDSLASVSAVTSRNDSSVVAFDTDLCGEASSSAVEHRVYFVNTSNKRDYFGTINTLNGIPHELDEHLLQYGICGADYSKLQLIKDVRNILCHVSNDYAVLFARMESVLLIDVTSGVASIPEYIEPTLSDCVSVLHTNRSKFTSLDKIAEAAKLLV